VDQRIRGNDCIHLGSLRVTNRDTPGHADGVTFVIGNWPSDAPFVAVVGDAIFAARWAAARPARPGAHQGAGADFLAAAGHPDLFGARSADDGGGRKSEQSLAAMKIRTLGVAIPSSWPAC
jgi:hypothetical protein